MSRATLLLILSAPLWAQLSPPPIGGGGTVPANFASGSDCSASGLTCSRTLHLTPTDVLSTSTTPFVLVPAPGAGKVIFPLAVRWRVHGGTLPYYDISDCAGSCLWWGDNLNPFYILSAGTAGFQGDGTQAQLVAFASVFAPGNDYAAFNSGMGVYPGAIFGGHGIYGTDPANYDNKAIILEGRSDQPSSLNRGPVLTTAVAAAGSMYSSGDLITQSQQTGTPLPDCVWTVTSVNGGGGVTGLANTTPGTYCQGGTGIATAGVGNLQSATVTMGNAGSGYANGDTGDVTCAGMGGTYTVTSSAAGAVTAVSVMGGSGYVTTTGCTTQAQTGGGDGALQLDTVVSPGDGLTTNTTVQHGDGTLTITIWYTVADK